MSIEPEGRFPIDLSGSTKRDVRTQFAALCWHMNKGKCEVLLITSRNTGRWVTPKGWPMDGYTASEAAAQEAWEEAGVTGSVSTQAVGVYSYIKPLDRTQLPCLAMVFPLKVKTLHESWPEKHERKRKWFPLRKAASKVDEDELRQIILRFAPRKA